MNTIVEGAAGTHRRLYPLFMRTPAPSMAKQSSKEAPVTPDKA